MNTEGQISLAVAPTNRGNHTALHCELSVYEAPGIGPLPPLASLQRRFHEVFSLGPGASRSVALPAVHQGSKRLVCICHDPILDPFPFPAGQASPNDRRLVIFASVELD